MKQVSVVSSLNLITDPEHLIINISTEDVTPSRVHADPSHAQEVLTIGPRNRIRTVNTVESLEEVATPVTT